MKSGPHPGKAGSSHRIPARILLADDQAMVREGVKKLLEDEPGFKVVGEAPDGREAGAFAHKPKPDVAILDIMLPVVNGIEAAKRIRAQNQ